MRRFKSCCVGLVVLVGWPTVGRESRAISLEFTGSHFDVGDNGGGKYFPGYDWKQCCIVPWRSDDSGNIYSARSTPTGRYYGREGWALFGTHFDFPNANSASGNNEYLSVSDPRFPNLEE